MAAVADVKMSEYATSLSDKIIGLIHKEVADTEAHSHTSVYELYKQLLSAKGGERWETMSPWSITKCILRKMGFRFAHQAADYLRREFKKQENRAVSVVDKPSTYGMTTDQFDRFALCRLVRALSELVSLVYDVMAFAPNFVQVRVNGQVSSTTLYNYQDSGVGSSFLYIKKLPLSTLCRVTSSFVKSSHCIYQNEAFILYSYHTQRGRANVRITRGPFSTSSLYSRNMNDKKMVHVDMDTLSRMVHNAVQSKLRIADADVAGATADQLNDQVVQLVRAVMGRADLLVDNAYAPESVAHARVSMSARITAIMAEPSSITTRLRQEAGSHRIHEIMQCVSGSDEKIPGSWKQSLQSLRIRSQKLVTDMRQKGITLQNFSAHIQRRLERRIIVECVLQTNAVFDNLTRLSEVMLNRMRQFNGDIQPYHRVEPRVLEDCASVHRTLGAFTHRWTQDLRLQIQQKIDKTIRQYTDVESHAFTVEACNQLLRLDDDRKIRDPDTNVVFTTFQNVGRRLVGVYNQTLTNVVHTHSVDDWVNFGMRKAKTHAVKNRDRLSQCVWFNHGQQGVIVYVSDTMKRDQASVAADIQHSLEVNSYLNSVIHRNLDQVRQSTINGSLGGVVGDLFVDYQTQLTSEILRQGTINLNI